MNQIDSITSFSYTEQYKNITLNIFLTLKHHASDQGKKSITRATAIAWMIISQFAKLRSSLVSPPPARLPMPMRSGTREKLRLRRRGFFLFKRKGLVSVLPSRSTSKPSSSELLASDDLQTSAENFTEWRLMIVVSFDWNDQNQLFRKIWKSEKEV